MSSVCLQRECIVTNNCKYDHAVFTAKQLRFSTVSIVSLETKFQGVSSIEGLNLCWGALGLCQTVVIADYMLTYDVALLLDSYRANHSCSCVCDKHAVSTAIHS